MSQDVEAFAAEIETVIFELADEIGLKIKRAEAEASESIRRFHELQKEQEQNRDRRVMLRQALEELPLAHSRAALDDDRERMRELNRRHREFRRELERLEDRAPQIVEEMCQLAPRRNGPDGSWHHHDVHGAQWSKVSRTFVESTRPLYRLQERLTAALEEALSPLEVAQERRSGQLESLQNELQWELRQRREPRHEAS